MFEYIHSSLPEFLKTFCQSNESFLKLMGACRPPSPLGNYRLWSLDVTKQSLKWRIHSRLLIGRSKTFSRVNQCLGLQTCRNDIHSFRISRPEFWKRSVVAVRTLWRPWSSLNVSVALRPDFSDWILLIFNLRGQFTQPCLWPFDSAVVVKVRLSRSADWRSTQSWPFAQSTPIGLRPLTFA